MTVNPYLTQEYQPSSASTRQPCAAESKSDVGGGRKTKRGAMAGAMIGVFVGLWMAGIPEQGGLSDFDFGRAMGRTVADVLVCAVAGYLFGWSLTLLLTRPGLALVIIGGIVTIGGVFATRRGLPATESIPQSRNELPSTDAAPLSRNELASTNSIPSPRRQIDLARHQEARRLQFKDEAFSVILPPNWKEAGRESDGIIYVGSTGVAFFGSIGLKVHPRPRRLTFEAIKDSLVSSVTGFVSFIEHGEITIDEKQALFVACHVRLKGRDLREVVYLVPGQSKMYELTVCCHEPPTASSRKTLTRVVNSLRVE